MILFLNFTNTRQLNYRSLRFNRTRTVFDSITKKHNKFKKLSHYLHFGNISQITSTGKRDITTRNCIVKYSPITAHIFDDKSTKNKDPAMYLYQIHIPK